MPFSPDDFPDKIRSFSNSGQNRAIRFNEREIRRSAMDEPQDFAPWLRESARARGVSLNKLGELLTAKLKNNFYSSTMSNMANGKRKISVTEAIAIAEILDVQLPISSQPTREVPLVGFVSAGAQAIMFDQAQGPLDLVPAPFDATPATVAVEVRGDSMYGIADNGWLIYFDERMEGIPAEFLGNPCVLWLDDGNVYVKRPEKGSAPHLYDLWSTNAPPMKDRRVIYSAEVTWIRPRKKR